MVKYTTVKLPEAQAKIVRTLYENGVIDDKLLNAIARVGATPEDNGSYKNQKQWIEWFNKNNLPMASANDILMAGQVGSEELLQSLQGDFDPRWLVTSTHNSYNPSDLSAVISHYHGQKNQKTLKLIIVPDYSDGVLIKKVAANKQGQAYILAEFDMEDGKINNVIDGLERLFGKGAEDIRVWTPNQKSRKVYGERAVSLDYDVGGFRVVGNYYFDGDSVGGLARRVFLKENVGEADTTQKK